VRLSIAKKALSSDPAPVQNAAAAETQMFQPVYYPSFSEGTHEAVAAGSESWQVKAAHPSYS
jgi:hypothetical protein